MLWEPLSHAGPQGLCLCGHQTLAEALWLLKSSPGPRKQSSQAFPSPAACQSQPGHRQDAGDLG